MSEWDVRYGEPGYAYGLAPNDFLIDAAHQIAPGAVLCLAEGEGRNAVFLAERGYDVTAVDQSAVGLAKADALARERGVSIRTVCADLAMFAIDRGTWSGIVEISAHVDSVVRRRMHRDVVAGLAPGGTLVLEAYTPAQLGRGTGGPRDVDRLMTLDGLRVELDGLELLVGREIIRDVIEGRFHTGSAAVVQVVARKLRG